MEATLDNASVKKKPAEPVADRFSYPLVIGSAIIGVVAALFSFCIGLYVTYVCWTDLNGGILFTGRACTLHQRVVGPVAITFGLFGVSATVFILSQGFITPQVLVATLDSLGGGGPAVAWNWVDTSHR
ncbi:putative transmembrane protein [Toxoplasma gondii TgCatPRC2]|uniref:Putative transmembrane protein n=1 Tax=Toxoplasma gondii TgCatPRC2 TaxID=1130821 RepID=A0A151HRC9_TOXGO|nr:putative transmembrane protein [Toxoplasma gondii TgCatPRC2]